jgi:hypothetical protein
MKKKKVVRDEIIHFHNKDFTLQMSSDITLNEEM